MPLSDDTVALLRGKALCFLSTVMPDGSPQVTEVWADTDGEHVVINTVDGHQKLRNIRRDPRVAVAIADPGNPRLHVQVRGTVVRETTDGAVEHIEELSQRHLGRPYDWSRNPDQVRVKLFIEPRPARS